VHYDIVQGWMRQLQVHYRHYLILVSLYTSHLKFLSNILLNGVASCKDVSRYSKRKLALHKVLF
jgi:hypothetical protein